MRISDWSSDVCSSDLSRALGPGIALGRDSGSGPAATLNGRPRALRFRAVALPVPLAPRGARQSRRLHRNSGAARLVRTISVKCARSEEHTSELQSLMRISYAVFCLKKKKKYINQYIYIRC